MANQKDLVQLEFQLNQLQQQQQKLSQQLAAVRNQLNLLKQENVGSTAASPVEMVEPTSSVAIKPPPAAVAFESPRPPRGKSDWEKFIGENIINKIGIAITVIGVFIGAKYAIDHELISPLTRIFIAYLFGGGLLAVSFKLRKKYENFSAVLLSGAMAILYFVTFIAYSFYGLLPQFLAFLLMVAFTVFTVLAAISYNRQIIAHLGLVGAYSVPVLLSDGSGKTAVLFSYMTIINLGVLAVAIQRYWKALYYSAFGLTWLIFLSWYLFSYTPRTDLLLVLIFSTIFFITFYTVLLTYKVVKKEQFVRSDVVLLILNSFIYFGIGYGTLQDQEHTIGYSGLFTVINGLIHFLVAITLYKRKQVDKQLFYLVAGLVLVFISMAIPVQLNGNWVTLLWAGEALLLFWIGRTRQVNMYERMSYIVMILAFGSLTQDWAIGYSTVSMKPVFNIQFLSSLLFSTVFIVIVLIHRRNPIAGNAFSLAEFNQMVHVGIWSIAFITVYQMFRLEIGYYFDHQFEHTAVLLQAGKKEVRNTDLMAIKLVWQHIYALVFLTALTVGTFRYVRNKPVGFANVLLNGFTTIIFLIQALLLLSVLRESYVIKPLEPYFNQGSFLIVIRYIALLVFAGFVWTTWKLMSQPFLALPENWIRHLYIHIVILWVLSSELIHWLHLIGVQNLYKLGLSILWGSYALLLIAMGISGKMKALRIFAIVLFGCTLLKLFFYDISQLTSIAKTIVFVSLGVLLLIISFLYNKYKHLIGDETNL